MSAVGAASEAPVVVLLHGLGANRHVWDGLAELIGDASAGGSEGEPAAVYAPDLRGHGAASWQSHYSFGAMAADVAEALRRDYSARPYSVVGHSMGGAVGMALASGWFGPPPRSVATIGVKLRWSAEELARIDDLAARPPRMFEDRAGAVEWFMKLAGLYGVFTAADPRIAAAVDAGVVAEADPDTGEPETEAPNATNAHDGGAGIGDAGIRWRVAADPATVSVGPPDIEGFLAAAKCPVAMAIGEHDPLVTADHHSYLADLAEALPHAATVHRPHVLVGLGHNAMTENPRAVADWLASEKPF